MSGAYVSHVRFDWAFTRANIGFATFGVFRDKLKRIEVCCKFDFGRISDLAGWTQSNPIRALDGHDITGDPQVSHAHSGVLG